MKKFSTFSYVTEASSFNEELLGHLTHTKDLPHEEPSLAHHAVDLINQFHKKRMGKASTVGSSLKTDGGASVVVGHDEQGAFVSDKHRHKRGVVARTPAEVDTHFGHLPAYASQLKQVLKHAPNFVNKGHTIQGDLLHTTAEKNKDEAYTPNRITYHVPKSKASLGIAVHTEVTNGVAHGVTNKALKHDSNTFVPEHEYKPEPSTYKPEDRAAVEHHLKKASELMSNQTSEHLTPTHTTHFTTYLNRSTRTGTPATVEGYKKHLVGEGAKQAAKLKTEAGQQKKMSEYAAHADHVDKHAEAFQRSLDIRHHLGQATEHVLKGVEHPDMKTTIDNKPSQGEGVVLQKKDKQGKMRPVSKLVPVKVSNAILNNPRFS